jgi:Rhs element Vgr protein
MAKNAVYFTFEITGYKNEFRVLSFSGTETLSQLFRYDIFVTSEYGHIPPSDLLGKAAMLILSTGEDTRLVSGIVSRFWWVGESGDLTAYYIEVVPMPWVLGQRQESRIFQNLSVPDIVREVMTDAGIPADHCDFNRLRKSYAPRDYCVQYQETDLNFIMRLMEEEGIFFFFQHHYQDKPKRGRHVMVLGDDSSCHATIAGKTKVIYNQPSLLGPTEEYIYDFQSGRQIRPGSVFLGDYEYQRPDLELKASASAKDYPQLGIYTYPGGFDTEQSGNNRATTRLEELQAPLVVGWGKSNCCRFVPGFYFTLDEHPQKSFNQNYTLLNVIQTGAQRDVGEESKMGDLQKIAETIIGWAGLGGVLPFSLPQAFDYLKKGLEAIFGKEKEYYYGNQFSVIPLTTPFRPNRLTPKPFMRGPQTARVVASAGEQLQFDDLGRIKVKFHWDRGKVGDDFKRTCFIRMAYSYAGSRHGIQFPPLAGDEVVVDFIDGDPDKPIVTGVVYNGTNQPPLKPEEKLENVILTPYQHRLHLSDREAAVTLNTGGGEKIEMIDGQTDTPYGKQIKLTTADRHNILMCKGAKVSGIKIETEIGQKMVMWDDPHPAGILIEDQKQMLSLQFNSDDSTILMRNKAGQTITIDCASGQVTIQGGGVEVVGGEVRINGSGSVKVSSAGKVEISAPTIEATGAGEINLSAPTITLTGANINLNAPMVSAMGTVKAGSLVNAPVLMATWGVVSPSYTPGVGNLT